MSSYNKPLEVKTVSEIKTDPYPLPAGYQWCELNLSLEEDLNELYELLKKHYVEDSEGKFRFDYSHKFLQWALNPPNTKTQWIIGVRSGNSPKLYGFISAIPVQMTVGTDQVNRENVMMAEVNFLCVHKQLREKRLAPLLIKEITRRVNLCDIWQAIFTSGTTLPTPFGTAQYWHRNLNPEKLVEIKFAYKPADQTMSNFIKVHKLPKKPVTPGLRVMEEADVPKVT